MFEDIIKKKEQEGLVHCPKCNSVFINYFSPLGEHPYAKCAVCKHKWEHNV